jgi:hypothetical protein
MTKEEALDRMIKAFDNCLKQLETTNGWNYVYVNHDDISLQELREWLKSIKTQLKYRWTEEDENYRVNAIYLLKQSKKYLTQDDDIICEEKWVDRCVNWLRNIKQTVHWKPSEEQMAALRTAKDSHFDLGYATKNVLSSLYGDLKEL